MTTASIHRPQANEPVSWLGGMTPNQFMRRHWQKKPLLVRNAFPSFQAEPGKGSPPISIDQVLALCSDDRAESRMIDQSAKGWRMRHGPFLPKSIPSTSKPNWTVLVQQVNTQLAAADRFLDAFRFIPEARLDDLMISVAGPGGGIGAHVDSYDVFLIQAHGVRRWEIAQKFDPTLLDDVPLKVLESFEAEDDWLLEAGDLLYLPPNVAHRGTAVGPACMTWSVGFRAPNRLALADAIWSNHLDGLTDQDWSDPWLGATDQPGEIPDRLVMAMADQFFQCLPSRQEVALAVAKTLSEPAPASLFEAPSRPDTPARFAAKAQKRGLRLACASRFLEWNGEFLMNGEQLSYPANQSVRTALKALANQRRIAANPRRALPSALQNFLYPLYLAGWIVYDSSAD